MTQQKTRARMGRGARVALIVQRLEALRARQISRRAPRRAGPLPTEARRAKLAALEAQAAAGRRKESGATQARWLVRDICREALRARRKSLGGDLEAALLLRMLSGSSATCDRPPAHTKGTWKVIRALDRAEALLLRLVSRGALSHAG